jgi:RHH-type proline utilization regulon transcriptional repressor/proline dehydrogenase/delta 1-pyrroline-5-carboxylate dehydrogenase
LSGTGPKAGGPHYLRRLVLGATAPAATAIDAAMVLPGPTGESNTLSLHPRGCVACIADDEGTLRAQIRLATATGNIALLTRSPLTQAVAADGEGRWKLVADALAAAPDAVLFAGGEERAHAIRQALGAADGPIVPLLMVDAYHPGDPMRLVCERTLTINTTASGGNASLLSLAE